MRKYEHISLLPCNMKVKNYFKIYGNLDINTNNTGTVAKLTISVMIEGHD